MAIFILPGQSALIYSIITHRSKVEATKNFSNASFLSCKLKKTGYMITESQGFLRYVKATN